VAVFLVWACCFAFQAELFRDDAAAGFGLGAGGAEAGSSGIADEESAAGGATAWLMFGCLVISMALTAFLGHAAVEQQLRRHENWVLNPDYARALDDVQTDIVDLRVAEAAIVQEERRYAALAAEEEQAAAQARALYKYLKQRATLWGWVLFCGLATAGGCADPAGGPGAGGLKTWSRPNDRPAAAVTRVLAVSPVLPPAEKLVVRQQLETELAWLADEAPIGSQLVVVDGLDCAPVARFEAGPGVARIRKKSFVKPLVALREFFDKSRPRQKDDGHLHLPRLAQTAGQWRLPPGSRLIVCGNPLFLNEGKDAFFSMQGGRVPSDGCLFEDPRDNLYSVVGREKSLAGVFVHMGWGDDRVFEDDSHRQAVQEFWAKYFSALSATLVTAQPSPAEAFAAARDGVTEPLPHGEPAADAEAAMVRTIKVPVEKTEQTPPKNENQEPGINTQAPPSGAASSVPSQTRDAPEPAVDEPAQRADLVVETPQAARDRHGNLLGSTHDLIQDGQMRGRRILLVLFHHDAEIERTPLDAALTAKGYEVRRLRPPLTAAPEFARALDEVGQLWLFASQSDRLPASQRQEIVARWRTGRLALCLLADNSPFTTEVNALLGELAPGATLDGDYSGEQTLHARGASASGAGSGFDPRSPLFHNVAALFEGTTVSRITGPGLTPACYASDGTPLVAVLERAGCGRVVVHGGFTSFYPTYWHDAGVSRFAVNAAGWLSGVDRPPPAADAGERIKRAGS